MKEIVHEENKYMDYEILGNIKCIKEKKVVIYGAGNYGKQAAEMLQELGVKYSFCDRDLRKHGMIFMGEYILSIEEIERKENLCIIVAIGDQSMRKEAEQTLSYINGVSFLSFFALRAAWKYSTCDNMPIGNEIEIFTSWHDRLASRGKRIKKACECPVLVYQHGKVGSSTVSYSLQAASIENAHIHRFFFKNDALIRELLTEGEQSDFIRASHVFQQGCSEYVNYIKSRMKQKRVITMVRDPIAVDLSTVFQWIGDGISDKYFAERLRDGKDFSQIVSELMVKSKNSLFLWFEEELKAVCGVDVLAYPFDREKGYTIIVKDNLEILLIKAEKLNQMAEVIREFTDNYQVELLSVNIGSEKEYAHIYREVKKKLEIPREYVEFYYKDHRYMDHFYTEEEKKIFLKKWECCIKKSDQR